MNTDKKNELLKEQVSILYKGLPASAVATITASLLTALVMLPVANKATVTLWASLLTLISFGRLILYLFYKKSIKNAANPDYTVWDRSFFTGTTLSAAVWGSAGYFLYIPGDTGHQAMLSFVLGGMAAGAVTSLSYRPVLPFIFIYLVTLPAIIHHFFEASYDSYIMSGMMLLILVFTSKSSLQLYQSSRRNILMRIEANKSRDDLRTSQQKLSIHIEKTPLAFIEWDMDFNVTEWNNAAENIFGYTKKEALGRHSAGLIVPAEIKTAVDNIWNDLIENRGGERSSNENNTKNGDIIFCEWFNTPLIDSQGNVIGVASIVKDVTAEKKMTRDLINARQEAEKANHAKSEFLSRMSHELRTPLNAILGFSQILQLDAAKLDSEMQEEIEHINKAGKHLLDLINEVLDIARVDSGEIELKPEQVNSVELIKNITEFLKPVADQEKISIHLPKVDDVTICTDKLRLKQILINLVSNAIKYNRENGKVEIKCERSRLNQEDAVKITVTDSGIGIKQEDQKHIFEPFTRINTPGRIIEGTGIGLAVTQRMVTLLNGRIGMESAPDKGSSFWFEIPLATAKPASKSHI